MSSSTRATGPDPKHDIDTRTHKIEATPEAVSEQAGAILNALSELGGLTADAVSRVEIVLIEVLNNVVEHAYRGKPGNIELTWSLTSEDIIFETRDRGRAMPGLQPPDPDCPPNNVSLQDLPEGGFGWFMIRKLTRSISYCRESDTNLLRVAIPKTERA